MKLPAELRFIKNSRKPQKKSTISMKGKICVISGATSGVGLEAAKKLAAGGADIVMLVRNDLKAQRVKQELEKNFRTKVDYFIADFSNLEQVRSAGLKLKDKYPHIDVLINSAGLHSTKRMLNEEGIEWVFCVNHLAPFLITHLLMDTLIASSPARVIQINSEGHRFGGLNLNDLNWDKRHYIGLRGYGASKTAQLYTVWEWAERLKGTGVTINAMHPGAVKTNIGSNNGKLYKWFLRHVTWHFLKEADISGEAIYYLASAEEIKDVSGKFFNLTILEKPASHALNKTVQKAIWQKSLELTKLREKGRESK